MIVTPLYKPNSLSDPYLLAPRVKGIIMNVTWSIVLLRDSHWSRLMMWTYNIINIEYTNPRKLRNGIRIRDLTPYSFRAHYHDRRFTGVNQNILPTSKEFEVNEELTPEMVYGSKQGFLFSSIKRSCKHEVIGVCTNPNVWGQWLLTATCKITRATIKSTG